MTFYSSNIFLPLLLSFSLSLPPPLSFTHSLSTFRTLVGAYVIQGFG